MYLTKALKQLYSRAKRRIRVTARKRTFGKRFLKYSFYGEKCIDARQYEAVITRWYHTIEKGLSYVDYRAGFGKDNVCKLLTAMENYSAEGYDTDAFFYRTALSTLAQYVTKNAEHGVEDASLKKRISALTGTKNDKGGSLLIAPLSEVEIQALGYKDFVANRHSFRHFSKTPVEIEKLEQAVALAQHTPSACNRQGWKTRIITNKDTVKEICSNQNGTRGFGHEFGAIVFVTGDIRCFNIDRELWQVYIDGGMYAQSILNALHYYHLASIPLSASLTPQQETAIRKLLKLHEAEVPIMLIGVGNYPNRSECLVARSERRPAEYDVIS